MIPQRNLSRLSNRLAGTGSRRIPESILERDYCTAWFLVGLARSPLQDKLAFKGGTALKRCYFGDYRFSEDLDFTLLAELRIGAILQELQPAFQETARASGVRVRVNRQEDEPGQNSHTFYLSYEGPLPPTAREKELKVDITIRELLVFPPEKRAVFAAESGEFDDLPADSAVTVYGLNEIAAEKAVTILDPARNEPRDLYDLWFLAEGNHVDFGLLSGAIDSKLKFRGKTLREVSSNLQAKEQRYKRLWSCRLANQMSSPLPEFEAVFRAVQRSFRRLISL